MAKKKSTYTKKPAKTARAKNKGFPKGRSLRVSRPARKRT